MLIYPNLHMTSYIMLPTYAKFYRQNLSISFIDIFRCQIIKVSGRKISKIIMNNEDEKMIVII